MLGLIFFHYAAFGCKTFEGSRSDWSRSTVTVKFGYWGVENPRTDSCESYVSNDFDGTWKFGRFVGVFGALLSWLVFALVMTASCFRYPYPKVVFWSIGGCMLLLALFSFLLLVGLSSETYEGPYTLGEGVSRSIAAGGVLSILAAFLWFGAAVSIVFFMKERERAHVPHARAVAPKQAVVEESTSRDDTELGGTTTDITTVVQPDGTMTKTIVKTTVLPDGSKIVERTIETIEK